MTDPLMTFYKTKDIAACFSYWKRILRDYPDKGGDPHFIRLVAGFLTEAIDVGSVPGDILEDEIHGDEYGNMLRKRIKDGEILERADAESLAEKPLSLFTMVSAVLDVYFGDSTDEEFLVTNWERVKACPTISKDVDLVALEPVMKEALKKILCGPPSEIVELERFPGPGYNDMCYVGFGATGERRYIERAIKALDQRGLDESGVEDMVALTAAWSLWSLSNEYPEIKAIIEDMKVEEKIGKLLEVR